MSRTAIIFRLTCQNTTKRISGVSTKYLYSQKRWQHTTGTPSDIAPKTLEDMPGLSSLPLIGSLHHFLPIIGKVGSSGNFVEVLKKLNAEYGQVVKFNIFQRSSMVILFDPEDFDKVFRAEEVNPSRPGFETLTYYRSVLRKSTFDGVYGLTTAEGAQWREFRTKVNPALLMPKLIKLYTPAITEVATEMVERIKKYKDDTDYIKTNFFWEMNKYSLEAVAVIGLGARLGCLKDDLPEEHRARQLIISAKNIMELSFKLESLPSIWKKFPTPTFKKIIKTFDTQWSISDSYIEEAKKKIQERGHDVAEEDKSIIERLLAIDQKVAVMMANEMLLAGIDTVAFAITGILYQLGYNLDKQNKLREEIRLGENKKRYLRACIKESLRLYPVIPGNLRRTTKEHYIAGYIIPKGIDIVAPNELLSKMEKYYPRPNEFIPERWIVDKSDPLYYGNAPPMVTQPFGSGVRSCIGRRIAELEIETFISKFIDEFEITWEGPPIRVVTKITNQFLTPYNFKLKALK